MLIEFFGENFGCFRDEFRLSMVASDVDPGSHRGVVEVFLQDDSESLRLLRVAAIYGANASGKSTVLRAAQSLRRLIFTAGQSRSDEPIPVYEPFAADSHEKAPVRLGLKGVVSGVVYDYEVSFDENRILHERLDKQLSDRTLNLFDRVDQAVTGDWTSDEQFGLIGREFRPNALLLSLADSVAPRLAGIIAPGLYQLLRYFDGSGSGRLSTLNQPAARLAAGDADFKEWLLGQLKAADVGVTELAVKRQRRVERQQGFLFEEVADDYEVASAREPMRHRLAFKHSGPNGSFAVPYDSESFGTRKVVELAPVLYTLFSNSKSSIATFVDEIGASLHPKLLSAIIQHVNCDHRDGETQGQLIFATHETSLIDDEASQAILRRDQVYFTEKDVSGVARLYSLAEFKERQNTNLRKRYLEGRYGAIPSLGTFPG